MNNLDNYLKTTLIDQVLRACNYHKKLTTKAKTCKTFENGDLVNLTWEKARKKALELGRPLEDWEVKRVSYCVGMQGYREHLRMFRSEYTVEELENFGLFPQSEPVEPSDLQRAIARLLGLNLD